jgi:hypothetical protein
MKALYRLSDNGYKKIKFPNATKRRCLLNFLEHWPNEEVTVLVDKVVDETREWLEFYRETMNLNIQYIDGGSSAQGFRIAVETALELPDSEYVYLVEDDYWHLPHSHQVLSEGVTVADYASLYDCPDKYVPASMGGNPLIDDSGGEITRVILTPSSHWKMTNSTTCTFATNVKTLREDLPLWKKWCFHNESQTHPHDFKAFLELREKGRSLITPLPGLSTHCEPQWATPLVDWDGEMA